MTATKTTAKKPAAAKAPKAKPVEKPIPEPAMMTGGGEPIATDREIGLGDMVTVERNGAERQTISAKALNGYLHKGFNVVGDAPVMSKAAAKVVPVADVTDQVETAPVLGEGNYRSMIDRGDVGLEDVN